MKLTRKLALDVIKVAGYHGDQRTFMRTYVENRISMTVAREAFEYGARAKRFGLRCHCRDCEPQIAPGYGDVEHMS